MFYYIVDTIVPALVCRAPYSSDALTIILPFGCVDFVFFWFVIWASDRLVVFDGCAKLLSPTFEDKPLLTEEKVC